MARSDTDGDGPVLSAAPAGRYRGEAVGLLAGHAVQLAGLATAGDELVADLRTAESPLAAVVGAVVSALRGAEQASRVAAMALSGPEPHPD